MSDESAPTNIPSGIWTFARPPRDRLPDCHPSFPGNMASARRRRAAQGLGLHGACPPAGSAETAFQQAFTRTFPARMQSRV